MAAGGQGPEWTPRRQLWAEGYREGEQELRRELGTIFQRKVQLDTAAVAGMPQGPGFGWGDVPFTFCTCKT